jgi:hypothetical protein
LIAGFDRPLILLSGSGDVIAPTQRQDSGKRQKRGCHPGGPFCIPHTNKKAGFCLMTAKTRIPHTNKSRFFVAKTTRHDPRHAPFLSIIHKK